MDGGARGDRGSSSPWERQASLWRPPPRGPPARARPGVTLEWPEGLGRCGSCQANRASGVVLVSLCLSEGRSWGDAGGRARTTGAVRVGVGSAPGAGGLPHPGPGAPPRPRALGPNLGPLSVHKLKAAFGRCVRPGSGAEGRQPGRGRSVSRGPGVPSGSCTTPLPVQMPPGAPCPPGPSPAGAPGAAGAAAGCV